MPELPDITVYIDALSARVLHERIVSLRVNSAFLLRTAVPDIQEAVGQAITGIQRMGKRIVFTMADNRALVLHLMIAGRLHWYAPGARIPARAPLLFLEFSSGTLTLTESGSKKRASLHYVDGEQALQALDPQGLEVLECSFEQFSARLTHSNHTLKRALTSPRIFSGIGNAYSDEILHKAQLSPVMLTQKLSDDAQRRLFEAVVHVLDDWTVRLRHQAGERFPEKVTAFRDGMAVHGRYQQPCPVCQTDIQRIRYASNETNYCPRCQTNGKLLADRSLSRLLKKDWPRTIEELEKG